MANIIAKLSPQSVIGADLSTDVIITVATGTGAWNSLRHRILARFFYVVGLDYRQPGAIFVSYQDPSAVVFHERQ